jgi:3-dehydroquinate synthase
MNTIHVELGARRYPIHIGVDILDALPEMLAATKTRGAVGVVTDSNVGPLYADRVETLIATTGRRVVRHTLTAGEEHKRLSEIEAICGAFLEAGLDRAGLIVALGGGVVGDMAGFAAACFMRGIPFIQIPTTIVAQVDSSVGGKTGVNHPLSKNSIGAFHQPSGVLIDMALLRTLPNRELSAGMAEVIKHGVIADAKLFAYLEQNVAGILAKELDVLEYPIRRSCEIKANVVAEDEREQGRRAILNYGHTFGHAIEAVTHYSQFLHGEAVALGMCAAGELARSLDMVTDDFVVRQRACCATYGLPTVFAALPVDEAVAAMHKDKKARAGLLKFVLARRMGEVVQRTDITDAQAREAFSVLRAAE